MSCFVYILYSPSLDKFYRGASCNLEQRLHRHQSGWEFATKTGVPWTLLWTTEKPTKSDALKLERKLKKLSRSRLIEFMIKYETGVASPDDLFRLKQMSGC